MILYQITFLPATNTKGARYRIKNLTTGDQYVTAFPYESAEPEREAFAPLVVRKVADTPPHAFYITTQN